MSKQQIPTDDEPGLFESRFFIPILTPSGYCPIKLTGTDPDSVAAWIDDVITYGYENGRNYTNSALKYWVRDFFEIGSDEFLQVCSNIG